MSPAREVLKGLTTEGKKIVGRDISKVEYGWPIGMPTSKSLGDGLHEVRSDLPKRIGRVFFYISADEKMVLLHAIVKKTQKTPPDELALARTRKAEHRLAVKTAKTRVRKGEGAKK